MNRLIFALALAPTLLTTAALAQTAPPDAEKQLWCGSAFVAAFSSPPPGVPSDQLALAQQYIDQGNSMVNDAGQKYLNAGFTEEPLTKLKTDLKDEVAKVVSGDGANAKFSFEDCQALMPNPPSGVPTANPSSEEAPADASSSSAAQ